MSLQTQARTPGIVSRRRTPRLVMAASAAGLAMTPIAAHAAEGSSPTNVSGVTVTAAKNGYKAVNSLTKLPAQLQDIPQSVTILNQTLLQSQGVSSLSDALRNVPG